MIMTGEDNTMDGPRVKFSFDNTLPYDKKGTIVVKINDYPNGITPKNIMMSPESLKYRVREDDGCHWLRSKNEFEFI
jgi:hypothetical protein